MSAAMQSETASYLEGAGGVRAWLASVDHKRIAISYLAAISSAFLLGLTFVLLLHLELLTPRRLMLDPATFRQLLSMHGIIMVFCCVLPGIPATLGHFVLPLMLGARNLAFPRLARNGLRLYLIGAVAILLASVTGAVGTGWDLVPPYTAMARLPLVLLGIGMHAIALHLVFTALNVLVTLHGSRPAEMGWFDLPVFGWAMATTAVLQLIAAPILASLGLLVIAEVAGTQGLFDPASAGDPLAWRRLFWFFGHPAIFIALVPAIGAVGEIFVTFSRKSLHAYRTSVLTLLAFGLLGLVGWGVHLVVGGISPAASTVFSAMGLLVAVPAAILLANWLATLHRGAIELTIPLLYAVAALVQMTVAGLGGIFLATLGTAEQLAGTTFETATLHYVMVGGVTTGCLGGLYYWWPKLFGRLVDEHWGRIGAGLVFIGIQLAFAGQFVLGTQGFPVRQHAYPAEMAAWHLLSGLGAAVLAFALLIVTINLLSSIRSGAPAPPNPWGGTTLEWHYPSPPPSSGAAPPPAGELYDFDAQAFDAPSGGYVQAGID